MHTRLVFPLFALAFAVGCGGSVVYVGDDGTGGGGSTGSVDDGSSGSVGPGSTGSGSSGQSGSTGSGSTGSGSSGPSGSTGSGTTPVVIDCFGTSCDASTEQCCATQSSSSCEPLGSDCGGFLLYCTDSSACADGQVCCAHGFGPGGDAPVAECRDQCGGGGGPGGGGGGFQLCATDAECDPGETCSEGPGGLMGCHGPGGPGGGGPGGGGSPGNPGGAQAKAPQR
jgi:hypothetical protein